ncbi:MFS transporter [Diaphorobacter aerolatus]|uniref:MFS transporter n=2 Tax=Diaphorobacter aerolatus TaxID=1288495 RepID=A0A7H0GQ49_9BURK|nr:MFS transporter [Diaphorobacter aerolatus]
MGFYGPPIFLHAVVSANQWSVSLVSAAITLHYLFGAFVVSRLPKLHARHGVPRITLTGAFALALGVVGWSLARQPWQLFAAAILSGAGWVTMSAAGINAMIAPWFERKRPVALSRAYNGASVGGMVFAPLWSLLIAQFGFPAAAGIISVGMLLVMIWLTQRVLNFTPEALGQNVDDLPAGEPSQGAKMSSTPASRIASLPGRALWKSPQFLTLAAAMSLSLFAQSGLVSHLYLLLVPMLGTQGAGWSMTLMTACAVLGRTLFARAVTNTRERRLLSCASFAMQMCGVMLLMTATQSGLPLWCGLVLFGAGLGNAISLPPLIAQADFASADVARVVALIVAVSQALYAFAPLTFAILLKVDASHLGFFVGALALQMLAITALWMGRAKTTA